MHVKDRQCIEVIGMVRFDGQGVLQRGFGFIVAQPFSQRFQFGGPPLSRKILANIHFANLLWSQILLSISLVNTALQKQVE